MRKSDINELYFHNGGFFSSEREWIHLTRTIHDTELIIAVKGEMYMFEEERKYTLSEGDYLMIHPEKIHGGWKVSDMHTEFYWLHFESRGELCVPDSGSLANLPVIVQSARHLLQIDGSPLYPEGTADNMFRVLFAELVAGIGSEPKNAFAAKVHEYVRSHSYRNITVADVAEKFGYNPDYISRTIKETYGVSLKDDIIAQRVNAAKYLLQTTDASVSAVSQQLGYSDPNLFDKFFRYHTHLTPTEYRDSFSEIHTNHK